MKEAPLGRGKEGAAGSKANSVKGKSDSPIEMLARATNFSKATIYNAFSGNGVGVSQESREKILKVAAELGITAPTPRKKEVVTRTVGVLIRYDITTSWYSRLVSCLESRLKAHSCSMNLVVARSRRGEDGEDFREALGWLLKAGVHGIIAGPIQRKNDAKLLNAAKERDVPVVVFNAVEALPFHSISTNIEAGGKEVVEYLLEKGHRHIGFAGFDEREFDSQFLASNDHNSLSVNDGGIVCSVAMFLAAIKRIKAINYGQKTRLTGAEMAFREGVGDGWLSAEEQLVLFPWRHDQSRWKTSNMNGGGNDGVASNFKSRWECGYDAIRYLLLNKNPLGVTALFCHNGETAMGAQYALTERIYDQRSYDDRFFGRRGQDRSDDLKSKEESPQEFTRPEDVMIEAVRQESEIFPDGLSIVGFDETSPCPMPVIATMGDALDRLSESLVDKLDNLMKATDNRYPLRDEEPTLVPLTLNNRHLINEIITIKSLDWLVKCHGDYISSLGLNYDDVDAEFEKMIGLHLKSVIKRGNCELINVMGLPSNEKEAYLKILRREHPEHLFIAHSELMYELPCFQRDLRKFGVEKAFRRWELPARIAGYRLLSRAIEHGLSILFSNSNSVQGLVDVYAEIETFQKYKYKLDFRFVSISPEQVKKQLAQQKKYFPEDRIEKRWELMKNFLSESQKMNWHITEITEFPS